MSYGSLFHQRPILLVILNNTLWKVSKQVRYMKGICLYNNSVDGYVNNLLRFVRVAGASLTAQLLTIISCGSRVYDNIKWSERSSQLMGSDSPVPPLYWQWCTGTGSSGMPSQSQGVILALDLLCDRVTLSRIPNEWIILYHKTTRVWYCEGSYEKIVIFFSANQTPSLFIEQGCCPLFTIVLRLPLLDLLIVHIIFHWKKTYTKFAME